MNSSNPPPSFEVPGSAQYEIAQKPKFAALREDVGDFEVPLDRRPENRLRLACKRVAERPIAKHHETAQEG
jgi:hypothetical protein